MAAKPPLEPVHHSIEVPLRPAAAFKVFVEQIDSWWPLAVHSVGGSRTVGCHVEGRLGGRIYETYDDGSLHLWGTVTEWQPPQRVVFSWHPGREASTAQEVELRFLELDRGTRVVLEHRGWEALGERAEATREGYLTGWPGVLRSFAASCSSLPAPA
jgi:uncharacterized protein YndB with AHSA1/START domain